MRMLKVITAVAFFAAPAFAMADKPAIPARAGAISAAPSSMIMKRSRNAALDRAADRDTSKWIRGEWLFASVDHPKNLLG